LGSAINDRFHQDLVAAIPHLRGFARILARNPEVADDLVQDTVARALSNSHQFTPGTNFSAWIFTILRSIYLNNVRRQRLQPVPLDPEAAERIAVPASQDKHLDFTDLLRAFDQLSHDHQEVLVLIAASGFTYDEAAAICGCPVGTVKSRLSRARRELAEVLEGNPETPNPRSVRPADSYPKGMFKPGGMSRRPAKYNQTMT